MRYPGRFEPEAEGGFTVYIAGVGGGPNPQIATCGDTLEEARANAQEALEGVPLSMLSHRLLPQRPPQVIPEGCEWIAVGTTIGIALELRFARAAAGMTQAQVARELGVSQQSYAELEDPEKEGYSISALERAARVFGRKLEIGFSAA